MHCTNYRIGVGHLCTNAIHQLYLNMAISCLYCMNYRVAVGLLVGQGWELKRPTLPYQKTNRYAVASDITSHSLSNLVQKASVLILDTRIIVSSCILNLLKTYGILSRIHV